MTILFHAFSVCSALTLAQSAIAADDVEFGRVAAPLALKRRSSSNSYRVKPALFGFHRRKDKELSLLDIDEREFSAVDRELVLDVFDDIFDMSMSMSMSFGDRSDGTPSTPIDPSNPGNPTDPSNPSSPSAPSNPSNPSAPSSPSSPSNPTTMNSPSGTFSPSFAPVSAGPRSPLFTTLSPTFVTTSDGEIPSLISLDPSETMNPSFFPEDDDIPSELTLSPTPTTGLSEPVLGPTTVFNLTPEGGVGIAEPPHSATTVVRLEIEYIVEGFVNTTAEFEEEVDRLILITSVMASLGASDSGLFQQLSRRLETAPALSDNRHRNLLSSSYFLRLCNSTIVDANCYIMGADVVYILEAERNADFAAYLAYLALNSDMGTYADDIPNVSRVEYLSPLPILPPVAVGDEDPAEDGLLTSTGETESPNPVVVGSAVGALIAGCISIGCWLQNRRVRDQQHMHLLDDTSTMEQSSQRQVVSI